ncbi:MFS transporter [Pseudonocardia parietis]|uniref:MFS family permease n=1 Tax=Pseudonocardia parietis TaxID=570936 RepID=A0ABS4VWV0_9PSEU|nr:MFS transporter [Pseudonocardia parietis]MBP2367989.1 MFS family permease [Pseudonocardia parietis]
MREQRSEEIREVRDWRGRRYRVGEDARALLTGWPRASILWQAGLAMAAIGVLQYGYGAAVPALMARNDWTLAEAFLPLAVWTVFQAGVGFPIAYLRQHGWVGPKMLMLAGAVLCEAGLLTLAYVPSTLGVLVGYSVVGGIGAGLVYAVCTSTVAKWYPERSASAVGIVTGAFAYGSVPVVVASVVALDASSLQPVLTIAAVVGFLLIAIGGLLFVDPPQRWWPEAVDPRHWSLGSESNRSRRHNPPAVREFSPEQALHTRALPTMALVLLGAGAVSLFDAAFLVVLAAGLGAGSALVALAAGLLVGMNGASRAMAVGASERIGRSQALGLVLGVLAAGQLLLAVAVGTGSTGILAAACVVAGLGGGGFYPLLAGLAREYFGEDSAVEVHGLVYSAKAGSGVVGVGLGALTVATWGAPAAFVLAGLLALGAAWGATTLRRPGLPRTLPSVVQAGPTF